MASSLKKAEAKEQAAVIWLDYSGLAMVHQLIASVTVESLGSDGSWCSLRSDS